MLMRLQKLEKSLKKCQQDVLKKKKLKMTGIKISQYKDLLKYIVPFFIRDQVKLSLHMFFLQQYTFTVSYLVCKCKIASLCRCLPKIAQQAAFSAWECSKKLLFTYHTFLSC